MRTIGCEKPIFYNVSHSVHLAATYFDTDIQGGTFQWYPTGLGAREKTRGNVLPNADHYDIPLDSVIDNAGRAKLVYKFDAADVDRSYIYQAIARSFWEAGSQVATHFPYDPTYGGIIEVQPARGRYLMSLDKLKPVRMVTLSRPYPTFLPYYFEPAAILPFRMNDIESLQVFIGPGIPASQLREKYGIAIEQIWIE